MARKVDLRTASRDTLIGIIAQQQTIIEGQEATAALLEKRIAQLEGQAKSQGSRRMPGLKPKPD